MHINYKGLAHLVDVSYEISDVLAW